MKKILLLLSIVLFTSCNDDITEYKGCKIINCSISDNILNPHYMILLENKKGNLFHINVDQKYFDIYGYNDTIK